MYHYLIDVFPGGELNSPQLAALQKVLQSDFCHAVREVYEHVYETVDISGSPEVRANATAKVLREGRISYTRGGGARPREGLLTL